MKEAIVATLFFAVLLFGILMLTVFGQKNQPCTDFTAACAKKTLNKAEAEMKKVYSRLLSEETDAVRRDSLKRAQDTAG